MGEGTKESPYTREDVKRLIEEHGGTAEGLDLSGKVFKEGIVFSGNNDEEGVNLSGAIINQAILKRAAFERCQLERIRLIGSDLEGAFFEEANIKDSNLSGANMENAHLSNAHLERAQMHGTHFEGAEFFYPHLEEASFINAFLDATRLSNAHLQGVKLINAKLTTNTEISHVDWGNYKLGEEIEGEQNNNVQSLKYAMDLYRRLRIWYTGHGIYDVAGEFFYREMEAKRKSQSWKHEPLSKIWSWIINLLCGYGERYGNVVISALVIIFGLAVIYVFGGLNLAYAIYFSAVSFTALGYGSWMNVTPEGWIRAFGVIESFLGVFMMALFLVTFIRKMTR